MRKVFILSILSLWTLLAVSQTKPLSDLTVEEIMQDPDQFIGTSPSRISWTRDSKSIFFYWDPDADGATSPFKISKDGGEAEAVEDTSEGWPTQYSMNSDESKIVFARGGDIFLKDIKSEKEQQLTSTNGRESNPRFHKDDIVTFTLDDNIYTLNLNSGLITQLTNFFIENDRNEDNDLPRVNQNNGNAEQDRWLRDDQVETSDYLKSQKNRPRRSFRGGFMGGNFDRGNSRSAITLKNIRGTQLSPDGNYISFTVYHAPENGAKNTIVPNYVTNSGYTEDIRARSKVGGEQGHLEIGIYNVSGDSVYFVDTEQLPGITDLPDYVKDYPDKEWEKKPRKVSGNDVIWSEDGKFAVAHFASDDNKDRWIMRLLPESGDLIPIDRQRDEAWIAGPGIGSGFGSGTFGFIPDSHTMYFQSEKSGYSHLYTHNLDNGVTRQLTKGNYEVYSPQLSKDGKKWYFTANLKHPGIRHFYELPLEGGTPKQITTLDGNNSVTLSPDEKTLAISYSYLDQPNELYVQPNKANAKAVRLTESQREGFLQYDWHQPEIITFKATDDADVHARLYKPENPNGAGVIFVHGAGYLQNVHYWWSTYFREFMFNNMLMAKGYTVLDIDYRASSGYGRDWRTGIYRHMGGKDLSDQIDGAQYLMQEHGVEQGRIGMYGGSYGGFITLFAMFQHPDVIAAGAALRSVTDWAHYNHGYTANILNTPVNDPIAYKRSSPIYFADGLEGHLLIAHGMVDTNVHFQDVVRLAQRLIELGKDNWEMALYPVENHGFTTPSSWTDEYKRIFKLFENTIGQK